MVISKGAERVSKTDTYLNCAEVFAYRSTCLKRKYGAVIVKNDAVLSTGYNGSPRGMENCCDRGECPRINALLNCSREQTVGADLYLTGVNPADGSIHKAKPCPLCARLIIQAGIRNVYLRQSDKAEDYTVIPAAELEWFKEETNEGTDRDSRGQSFP